MLQTIASPRSRVHGALKLAQLFEAPEPDFAMRLRALEQEELFIKLVAFGALSVVPYANVRFAARSFGDWELRASSEGLPELLDGQGDLAALIVRVGEERFRESFLGDSRLSDEERGKLCGLSREDARRLRELVDRLYVQAEFEGPFAQGAPAQTFSSVAGIQLEDGKPVLAFFNREIWKGRYRIDEKKRELVLSTLERDQAAQARRLLAELEFIELRKSTLYRILEFLITAQTDFLASGDQERRKPLTQRIVATRLDIDPSVLNRLISNKSVQLPWKMEAPLKVFMPSQKRVLRDHLYDFAIKNPRLSDEGLRIRMRDLHGALLSRRSIAQYRKELGLGPIGARVAAR